MSEIYEKENKIYEKTDEDKKAELWQRTNRKFISTNHEITVSFMSWSN